MTEPTPPLPAIKMTPEPIQPAAATTTVFTEPRTPAQIRKDKKIGFQDSAPYHRVWTILSRGIFLMLELGAIGYTAYVHDLVNGPDSPFEGGVKDFGTRFAAFSIGVAVDLCAIVACFFDKYDACGAGTAGFLDLVPGILGIMGLLNVGLAGYGYGGTDYYDRVGYKNERMTVMQLLMAVGYDPLPISGLYLLIKRARVLHIVSCFGVCVGCYIVYCRPASTVPKAQGEGEKGVADGSQVKIGVQSC
ncbi:hypothetical protein B0T21DRAFT_374619 [Apiosordaria backusii]|uniref:Uncharacterized protein n=1 Tax=Apiosordaria backusii TaxID=314023 RepID=A0AA40ANC8_9PEZI|nr:hypothetical protein B0T21DRAFT_374619 [Apiosordaria backusii]